MKKYLLSFPYLQYLPIFLAPIILFAPVLFTGKALFWGTPSLQFVPWWAWTWQTLLSGHLPLWNPLLGMGAPLLANYQLALFYPPNWIFLLLAALGGIPTLAWGQALFIAAHLCWAGIGMVRLVRKIGLGVFSQTVSGLAFCLSGYLVGRAGFLSMTAAVAWLPWILLGVLNVISVREDLQAEIEPLSQNDNITLVYNKERHNARLRSTLIFRNRDRVTASGRARSNHLVHAVSGGDMGSILALANSSAFRIVIIASRRQKITYLSGKLR